MKILSCYVENYGALCRQGYEFNEGITAFFKENGAGKTTLASFIQAMFYGLESYRQNTTEFCDRQHFFPFAGGTFGGSLTFEKDGKIYKIERTFGEKSATADTCTVYCNGEPTLELGLDVGKAVFGIDKESFSRTAFIGSDEIEIASTSSINAKLSGLLQGADDDGDLDDALAALEKTAKTYKKAKAGRDKITEETERIEETKNKLRNAETVQGALEERYQEYAETQALAQSLLKRIALAQKRNELLTEWEHYEDLLSLANAEAEKARALEARYPLGVPSKADVEDLRDLFLKKERYETQAEQSAFTAADEAKLTALAETFADGIPDEETLDKAEKAVGLLEAETAKIDLLKERTPTDEENRLARRFALRTPNADEIAVLETLAAEHKKAEADYAQTPERVEFTERTTAQTKPSKAYAWVAAVAAVFVLAGVALAFVELAVGVALLAVGAIVLVGDGFLYLNKKSSATEERRVERENPEKKYKEAALKGLEERIRALLLPYGYEVTEGVSVAVYAIRSDAEKFRAYSHTEAQRKKQVEDRTRVRDEQASKLSRFFRQYGLNADGFMASLSELRTKTAEYKSLCARKKAAKENAREVEEALRQTKKEIDGYAEKYGLERVDVRQMETDLIAYKTAREGWQEKQAKAEAYKREKSLAEKPQGEREDLETLSAELEILRQKLAALEKTIAAEESVAEKADEYRAELEEAKARLQDYKKRHELLTASMDFLKQAERALQERYVKPIKEEFVYYADLLERALGERITMTKDFKIHFDRHGKERSEKHLSAGQKSLCALCFRLALIKNMYAGQKPFLVLDDPFVYLDENHLQKARALLKELSKDFQIVYFTCHQSRVV